MAVYTAPHTDLKVWMSVTQS